MANIAELERVLTYITDHPEKHNQEIWNCETGACFAGHATLLNGYEPMFYTTRGANGMPIEVMENGMVRDPGGRRINVGDAAQDILGIDADDATVLFNAQNTREKLALMVKDIANGEALDDRWVENDEGGFERVK